MKRMNRKVPRQRRPHKGTIEQFALLLRNNMTKAESIFWKFLKKRQRTWVHKFEPQYVVEGYIADFASESLKLLIEIDGKIHLRKDIKRKDALRTRRLRKAGWTVIRFKNADVFSSLNKILDMLEEVALE
jgi:very-short-patch-repair endonuclease